MVAHFKMTSMVKMWQGFYFYINLPFNKNFEHASVDLTFIVPKNIRSNA